MSALIVAALTGVALTVLLAQAFGNLGMALSVSIPAAGVMAAVMFFVASDDTGKKAGDKPAQETRTTEGE